ncbi:MAG: NADP-dependent oxidoreductase [Myxococcota bacterium]
MSTMRAFEAQPDSSLAEVTVPIPEPGMTQVRIRAQAIGINPVDYKVRNHGPLPGTYVHGERKIFGWDVAGVVEAVGAGVTRFEVGDRVFGMPAFPQPAQAYAEFVVSDSRQVARIPEGVSMEAAGAVPLAGLTAWQAVHDTLSLGPGSKVLITAASGGVGHLAVQLAKEAGAEVWGTASKHNHERLAQMGVDHLIDHRSEDFADHCSNLDAVIDLYGDGGSPDRAVGCLRRGGRLVVIPSPSTIPNAEALEAAGVRASWMLVEPDGHALEQLGARMADGRLKVEIGTQKPFADLPELNALCESGRGGFGKLVATLA